MLGKLKKKKKKAVLWKAQWNKVLHAHKITGTKKQKKYAETDTDEKKWKKEENKKKT